MADNGAQSYEDPSPTTGRVWTRSSHRRTAAGAVAALCLVAAACSAIPDPTSPGEPTDANERQARIVAPDLSTAQPTNPGSTEEPTEPNTTVAPAIPSTFQQASTLANIGGCELFPPEHYMNATGIDRLPVHPNSDAWVASLGGEAADLRLARSIVWNGFRGGMPFNIVDSRKIGFSSVMMNPSWSPHTYRGGYPVPKNPMVQGHPGVWTDQHMMMIDVADCTVYETIGYEPLMFQLFGLHTALTGAKYRLDTVEFPVITTNAPKTPMIGQYVMQHEVDAGLVPHVIGFCSDRGGPSHVWPARASDGPGPADAMPMGAWLRLADDVELSAFHGTARPIAEALRRHGAVLTDTCGHRFYLQLENSSRWKDAELDQIRALTLDDFEVVDPTPMIVDEQTWEIR